MEEQRIKELVATIKDLHQKGEIAKSTSEGIQIGAGKEHGKIDIYHMSHEPMFNVIMNKKTIVLEDFEIAISIGVQDILR